MTTGILAIRKYGDPEIFDDEDRLSEFFDYKNESFLPQHLKKAFKYFKESPTEQILEATDYDQVFLVQVYDSFNIQEYKEAQRLEKVRKEEIAQYMALRQKYGHLDLK